MIELATKAWKTSIPGTILMLVKQGFDLPTDVKAVQGYAQAHVAYRKTIGQLWQKAQPYFTQHNTLLRPLLSYLGLSYDIPPDRWKRGPGLILGGLVATDIEKTFHPYLLNNVRQTSAQRTFTGGNWTDVLVFPFYAAPDRITAFGFIGRQGRMEHDYVFRTANVFSTHGVTIQSEAGLAMHPQTQEIAADWGKCVFAVSDPLLYLDLHMRQFSHSNNAIPVVLWQDCPINSRARTRDAWKQFHDRKIVFWDPTYPIAMIQQAVAIDGHISLAGPRDCTKTPARKYCSEDRPTVVCRKLQKTARLWPKALARLMLRLADSQIEELFLQLQLDGPQMARVRDACKPGLRDRFDAVMAPHNLGGSVSVDGSVVVAQDDCWYTYRQSDIQHQLTQICNAQVRLDRVVTYPEPGHSVYSGVVRIKGEDVPFAAPSRAFRANAFRWLSEYLESIHKPTLHYVPRWSNLVTHIACQFHEPATVPGVVSVGWDDKRLHFAIPGYRIGVDGVELVPDPDIPMPAVGLVLHDTITETWGRHDDYGSVLYWATLGCILDDVLAPALLRDTRGIGLLGLGARTVGEVTAKAAGCLPRVVKGPAQLRAAFAAEQQHHWPSYVGLLPTKNSNKAVRGWLTQAFPRNCVTPVHARQPDWWTVLGEDPTKVPPQLLNLTKRIVPAYLRDVCQRRLQVGDVHEDLAEFIGRQGGVVPLDKVRKVLTT